MNNLIVKDQLKRVLIPFVSMISTFIVDILYGGFWNFRKSLRGGGLMNIIYSSYMDRHHFFVGMSAYFKSQPILPHGNNGIHISSKAVIGRNVVIFQQVTIGSNTILGHNRYGSPVIGDNVYIGAGAKIIGKVKIGDNCRIGANAVVVKDMESNTVAVSSQTRYIHKTKNLDNQFNYLEN